MSNDSRILFMTCIAGVLLLSACGGGSGTPQPNPTPTPETPIPAPEKEKYQGFAYRMNTKAQIQNMALKVDDPNVLNVEGQRFALGSNVNRQEPYRSTTTLIVSQHLRYGHYGYAVGNNKNMYIFHQGADTPMMPTSGVAIYSGYGLIKKKDVEKARVNQANFKVDFGVKRIQGGMRFDSIGESVSIDSRYQGNQFSGKDRYINYHGGFYGPKADEIAGSFSGVNYTKGYYVVGGFGAKREQ